MGALFCVILVVGAEPIIHVFAGASYDKAIPVLRIQAFALLGGSLTQAWLYAVVAVRGERSLVVVNAIALASVAVLGAILIPTAHAIGASAAAVAGETIMALAVATALTRFRPQLRPSAAHVGRLLLATGVGLLAALLPIPPAVAASSRRPRHSPPHGCLERSRPRLPALCYGFPEGATSRPIGDCSVATT